MTANASSSFNTFQHCSDSTVGVSINTLFIVTKVLLLPIFLLVLYLGYQKWRQQCSFATTSHSDIFTYHSTAVELIYALGAAFYLCGKYPPTVSTLQVETVGGYLSAVVVPGQASFYVLTCVERYLAVVHPVLYLGLRHSRGVRLRNISIGCVWLLCLGWMGVTVSYTGIRDVAYLVVLCTSLVVVSFCSISVLCVLIRPGPGKMDRDRERVDQSKQRAFYTITAILGVQWFYFFGIIFSLALYSSHTLSFSGECMILFLSNVTLPSNVVLPLLFLHKAGRLHCSHSSSK